MFNKIIRFFLEKKVITFTILIGIAIWGLATAPFNWISHPPKTALQLT